MAGVKRSEAAVEGQRLARAAAVKAGLELRAARKRRRASQIVLARRAGLSRSRLAEMEGGDGTHASLEHWFALAKVLGLFLKFEFGRDPQQEVRDAGHLDMQELVVRVAGPARWTPEWESRSNLRWIDVRLDDRRQRRILIVECCNTVGDLGEAVRSSHYKVREAEQRAVAIAGEGEPFAVGLVWVVRDTKANRTLLVRYGALLESRFRGSSVAWLGALTLGHPMPHEPGLIWCDINAVRLFARRQPHMDHTGVSD